MFRADAIHVIRAPKRWISKALRLFRHDSFEITQFSIHGISIIFLVGNTVINRNYDENCVLAWHKPNDISPYTFFIRFVYKFDIAIERYSSVQRMRRGHKSMASVFGSIARAFSHDIRAETRIRMLSTPATTKTLVYRQIYRYLADDVNKSMIEPALSTGIFPFSDKDNHN